MLSSVDKFRSLADFLGVEDPQNPDAPVAPAPVKMSSKVFCENILNSSQYRESLIRRIIMDDLPSAVECMLWDRAKGKVVERHEVKDTTNVLEGFTVEQLEQRALFLAEVARRLREAASECGEGSVH